MVLFSVAAISSSFAQNDLGADCGCPPVSIRPNVNMSDLLANPADSIMTTDLVLNCNNNYIIDRKFYVANGTTLTIKPGTVLKGLPNASTYKAHAIVVAVGSKIIADGTPSCPIVFTSTLDPMDGTHPICSKGEWGGLVLLGQATNNLTTGNKYLATGYTDGVGYIEGYDKSFPLNLYGKVNGSFNDDDNSGILRYVSVRHAGAILKTANELNGISLGSVGRGTTIDHIEIVGNDDDGIEFFGGTVNVSHVAMWWVNDDMFDWDLGWKGNAQFLFGVVSPDRTALPGSDNAFESDGIDKDATAVPSPLSHPVVYNATFIGDGLATTPPPDGSGASGIRGKEDGEGEIYNSIIANFRYGVNLDNKTTLVTGNDAYQRWNAGGWIIKNNIFLNMTNSQTFKPISVAGLEPSAADIAKFTADGNTYPASVPAFDYTWNMTCSTGIISDKFDAVPTNQSSSITPPANGFFRPVSYKGAFGASEKSWLSDWAYGNEVEVTTGLAPCPLDVNSNGAINASDVSAVIGAFGSSCQK